MNIIVKELRTPVTKPAVYLLIEAGVVVYVGQARSVVRRVDVHAFGTKTETRKSFDRVLYIEIPEDVLDAVEARLILMLEPKYNKEWRTPAMRTKLERGRVSKNHSRLLVSTE